MSNKEMDFSDRLNSLAGIEIDTAHSSPTTSTVFTNRLPTRDPLVEELERQLKQARNEASAKSDAFDLIYCQWQLVQKDLDKTKHEAESMKAKLREKDALIDNLQFKLFWVESDMNDAREGLDVESDLQPLRPRENVTRTTSVRGGVRGAMVRRVEFAPGEENMKTPIRPRTYQFDSAEKEMVAASQGRGSDKPRKRSSFFSGLFKSKKSIFNMSGTSTRRRRRSF